MRGLMPHASATFETMRLARSRMPPRYSAQCRPPGGGLRDRRLGVVRETVHPALWPARERSRGTPGSRARPSRCCRRTRRR